MMCLLLLYVLFSFTGLRIFIVMTYTITLKYFVISYFHMFLLWFIDLRHGHPYNHIIVSDTTSYWLDCRPIRSQYAATLPAYHLPTVPSVRTREQLGLCIVSHYQRHNITLNLNFYSVWISTTIDIVAVHPTQRSFFRSSSPSTRLFRKDHWDFWWYISNYSPKC